MRIATFIAAGALGLLSLGLLAAGTLLLWGDAQKDEAGYISTASERFATNTHALSTDNLDVDTAGLDWVFGRDRWGTIRLEVEPRDDEQLFVGIAPTREVRDYLRGSDHELVRDVSFDPFRADYEQRSGDTKPGVPAAQEFWVASSSGRGTRELTWEVEDGDWSVVVMNENASAGVDARVKAGADVPFLAGAGWGSLAAGLIMLALSAGLAVLGVRGPRRRTAVAA
jgi:hypothetical protein